MIILLHEWVDSDSGTNSRAKKRLFARKSECSNEKVGRPDIRCIKTARRLTPVIRHGWFSAHFCPKMLNRKIVIGLLSVLNIGVDVYIVAQYGLSSINNWLLIVSLFLLSLAIYQVLGIVEGYADEQRE